jgi:hypothetical protein
MDLRTDVHIEAAKIQNEIKNFLGLRSSELVFEYSIVEGKTKLDLITINPRHNQSFLFKSVMGFDKTDTLHKMLDYVKTQQLLQQQLQLLVSDLNDVLVFDVDSNVNN